MYLEIIEGTIAAGEARAIGDIVDVSEYEAAVIIGLGRAVVASQDAPPADPPAASQDAPPADSDGPSVADRVDDHRTARGAQSGKSQK